MDEPAAYETAEYILNFFGYDSCVIDNRLRPQDRVVFYLLADVGLLKTDQEQVKLTTGRNWRIFYWILDERRIEELEGEEEADEEPITIYDDISDEEWFAHTA